jgi:serine/threonine-protein kinase
MTSAEAELRERIGKYSVTRLLGEGAMGVVYEAHDPNLDRRVAIKMIRGEVLGGKQAEIMVARFKNEAMAAGRLQHPGIVAVYDYGEEDGAAYIVMELAPGEDLDDYVARRAPIGFSVVGSIMLQLRDALQFAHESGVVHRDIKPSNMIVSSGGRLKISDFGIARIATSNLTQTGAALGTPAYMAPEQYSGVGVDHRADLFSAGVILYELVTGQQPFVGQSIQEVAYKICHVDPVRPTKLHPNLPPSVDGIVLNALAKDKEARFKTALDFAGAVADIFGGARPLATAITRSGVYISWPPDIVKKLEAALVPFAGPFAAALVRRNVAKTKDPDEVVDLLRRGLRHGGDDPNLIRELRSILGATGQTTLRAPVASFSPAELDRATQALVEYVGPIAKVLVKKAAAQAADWKDLCQRLSEHLATEAQRAQFLKTVEKM